MTFEEAKKEALKIPEVRLEYERLEKEYAEKLIKYREVITDGHEGLIIRLVEVQK